MGAHRGKYRFLTQEHVEVYISLTAEILGTPLNWIADLDDWSLFKVVKTNAFDNGINGLDRFDEWAKVA